MTARHTALAATFTSLAVLPFFASPYVIHLLIQILLWGFVYTAWSIMGRFGFVSLGHGAFMGVGAYVPALLWNYAGVTPWVGIPLGVALAVLLGVVIGYPCFHLRVIGHYFALVTLTRHHRWVARLNAKSRRFFLVRATISRQTLLLCSCARAVARRSRHLALDRPQHRPPSARRDFGGRRSRRGDRDRCFAQKTTRHHDQCGTHRAGRGALRAIPHVSQSRNRLRHRRLAANCFRRDCRRYLRDAWPNHWRSPHDISERRFTRRVCYQFHWCSQYHLRHSSRSVHHIHAAWNTWRARKRERAAHAVEAGGQLVT